MAINKNFVIKNGVEVNTNLLVGDSTLNKVGIATTVPGYTLHIGVGDGARGGIGATDITVTGIATIGVANSTSAALSVTGISTFDGLIDANGGISARTAAVQDLTSGRVVLAGSGGELEDNGNLTFDGTTLASTINIGVGAGITLQRHGGASISGITTIGSDLTIGEDLTVNGNTTLGNASGDQIVVNGRFASDIVPSTDGARDLGASGLEFKDLFIDGTANIDSLAADTAAIGDLTDNRVVIAGSSGELEDDANFTYDGSKLNIGAGTGVTVFNNGNAVFAGIVTVGGDLVVTGDYSVDEISARNLTLTGIATVGTGVTLQPHGGVSIAGITTIGGNLNVSGTATFDTALANSNLANSTVSYGGVSLSLGGSDSTPAFDLSDATNYPTSSLSGTITNAQLAGSIANNKLANSTVSFGGVSLALGGSDGTPAFDLSDATNYPTSSLSGTITNAQLAGSIANGKLANSTVSFGGISLALGGTDATPAFDLSDATNYPTSSLSGTITNAQLAGSIANSKLANSTVSFGGISLALGGTDATPAFNLADATGLPISSGVSGLGANVATFLATPSSANLRSALTDETGTGAAVFAASPTLTGTVVAANLDISGDIDVDGTTNLDLVDIDGTANFADNVVISGVTTTGENLGGFKRLVGAASSTVVSIAVTVAAKTADHRYFGQGSGNGYWLDGVQSPFLTLVPGKLYYFDQSHSTNSGHPLRFYLEQDKANAYTTEITTGGTPGSSGAYTQIGIGTASNENNHPAVLHYQCSAHGLMGNAVATQSNAVNLPDSVVTTVRGNLMPGSDSSYDIGADGTRFTNIYGDTLYGDGSNLTNLPTQVSIANNADNRVITGGSGVNLNGEANLTFNGSTLGVTGSVDISADIDVDGTANLDVLDVDGASNFGADVVFAAASGNITFDQDEDALVFQDNIEAVFGGSPGSTDGLHILHNGSDSFVRDKGTGGLYLTGTVVGIRNNAANEDGLLFAENGAIQLFHDGVKIFQTTGIGITVGLSSVQHNGNAAFPGITTIGTLLQVNGRIDANSGANISGIATITAGYLAKLAQSNGDSGQANEVPVANGSGGWSWASVSAAGASDLEGLSIEEEGSLQGNALSVTKINFTGNDVTASVSGSTATVNVDSNIQGITTSGTSFLHDITQTGVTTLTSDQQAAFNVGTAATIYSNGNIRTVGVVTAFGGVVAGAAQSVSLKGSGLIVGTGGSIASNGNAGFAGIVTAGGGFNIGIQSAGIVIAKNVGISTLNFVGSGNSITYFAATNTLDVSIAGSSGGGGGGGVSETETAVSSTSATSTGSFAKASFRSASILAQITQGSAYQVGRYLLIHDGTTVTTIEESAVATGSMLGTFEGVINGSNVEFRVTMSSSSSATVTTKIDTISIP